MPTKNFDLLGEFSELKQTVIFLGSTVCLIAILPFVFSTISSFVFPTAVTYRFARIVAKDKLARTLVDPAEYKLFFDLGEDIQEISVDGKQFVQVSEGDQACIQVRKYKEVPVGFQLAIKERCN